MKLNSLAYRRVTDGRLTTALSPVSVLKFTLYCSHPVLFSLVDDDGEIIPCGTHPPGIKDYSLELKNYVAFVMEAQIPKGEKGKTDLMVQMDARHKAGEPISPIPLKTAVRSLPAISEAERTRRIVMATLRQVNVMPSEGDLIALEAELQFDLFGDDFQDGDFGDLEPQPEGEPGSAQEQPEGEPEGSHDNPEGEPGDDAQPEPSDPKST